MKHRPFFKDKALVITLAVMILIVLGYFVYLFGIKVPICTEKECFVNSLRECSKSAYVNEYTSASWYYEVKGKDNGNCIVKVKAIEVGEDLETSNALRDKTMDCAIPLELAGSFMPESKIEYCHGLLRETIQDLMIKKMQLYIIQNVGQISLQNLTA